MEIVPDVPSSAATDEPAIPPTELNLCGSLALPRVSEALVANAIEGIRHAAAETRPGRARRQDGWPPERITIFLNALAQCGSVELAAGTGGIGQEGDEKDDDDERDEVANAAEAVGPMASVNFDNFTPPGPPEAGEIDGPMASVKFDNFTPPADRVAAANRAAFILPAAAMQASEKVRT